MHERKPVNITPFDLKRIARAHTILLQDKPPFITVAKLAKKVDINRNKLQYGFKQLYGLTIRGFRERNRMEKAKKLLSATEERVETIATLIGYSASSAFTIAFKKKYGIPPVHFRRKVQLKRMKDMLKAAKALKSSN